ncbi:hypothetical protein BN439_2553 [Erwinia amylovora Ea644]|nr:hypothetical protein BN439_2553 [Erwinia amylovora Ea644]CCP07641.1 hypothetical protein BN440_2624 [Erwinia amylovora MR1]
MAERRTPYALKVMLWMTTSWAWRSEASTYSSASNDRIQRLRFFYMAIKSC